jgi:hypothetical protein
MRTSPPRVSLLAPLCLSLLAACASAPPPPVPITGDAAGLHRLDGEWVGDYWSGSTGRRGTIRFALEADVGAAWGEVWMDPAPPARTGAEGGHIPPGAAVSQPLQIRFVRVGSEGVVSGTLEPYRDPACDCLVSTTFHGEIDGDSIAGEYTTRGPRTYAETGGRWQARRTAARKEP